MAVDVLMLGPGERIDAWAEMNHPGVWILGAPEDPVREGGLGIVIEYANQHERLDMVFEKLPRGAGKFNSFTVNGKVYPHEREPQIYGKATSGVIKDTVVVPTYGRASVDFTADQPGPALFHCHIQQHID